MATKRALVIGSQLPPLRGVHEDAATMASVLEGLGFSTDKRIESSATRAGILDGYCQLIARTESDDAAVVYYAGHGGYALNSSPKPGERTRLQCIFPTDWTETGEFRGILDIELSILLAQLTEKTKNATVIMDCCHAAEMSRSPRDPIVEGAPIPRVYGAAWAEGVPEFLAKNPLDLSRTNVESNPYAVRFVATEFDRQAFEAQTVIGGAPRYRGIFTVALQRSLEETGGAPVSWQTLGSRVREIVLMSARDQRPSVEGPANRLLFTTQVLERPDAVVYFEDNGVPFLRANRLLGATPGAVYHVMPPGQARYDATKVVATATVVNLIDMNAQVSLQGGAPRVGALAFPTRLPYPPLPVAVQGSAAKPIQALVQESTIAELVTDPARARFEIVATDDSLALLDGERPAIIPTRNDDGGREKLLQALARWSKADAIRSLVTEGLPSDALEVSWGRVENGVQIAHGPGARVHAGDFVYVTITNRNDRPLFYAILDVGVSGAVSLMTSASRNGRRIEPGETQTFGKRDGEATVRGNGPMYWPATVPADSERRETFVVIAATQWTDFNLLESRSAVRAASTRLETILDSFRRSGFREGPSETAAGGGGGFWVQHIDFDLSPTPRSAFAIDRSLDARALSTALTLAPRFAPRALAPSRIAVRIEEILIHNNRALWGRARIRVDALALTGAPDGRAYHARTEPFPRIADGERLSLRNLLVYEGPVAQFLDFGIWISRDEKETQDLQELLASAANDEALQKSVSALLALSVAAPQAGAIVGAGVAVGTVMSFASKLLDKTIGNSIGLYRTSFLPHEAFGVGRHPPGDVVRAQDFSFAYSIVGT